MDILTTQWLEAISKTISSNIWLAPLLALLAGIITSFSPCALTSIPLVIGYVGGVGGQNTTNAFRLSAVFSLGMAITYTILGIVASLIGQLMLGAGSWWFIFLGVLMLFMALQTWEIFNFIPSSYAISKNRKRGYFGAFVAGILGGFFSSPCATPVLVVLLAAVAKEGNMIWGVSLLLVYSLGHSVLVLIAGTSVSFVHKLVSSESYGKGSKAIRLLLGTLMVIISLYMFYLGF
ncbi:cytochrome c biogenesis CcdA family protein [Dendrosporobacter sp. 1207_IL3150]|uniref:cytochrome c biogenesis CcdA family protein n=1 Tax=Dendrosporobacter sp. 1207_IL3150 TaxID=3084054 RepID=UPI002FDB3C0C